MVTTTERDQLTARIAKANEQAKALSRRGLVGTLSQDYDDTHAWIDLLLTDWEQATT